MEAALLAEGQAVGVLADSLEKAIRPPEMCAYLESGDLVLLTPYHPKAGFSVGTAMGRNKLIYALADFALVVSSDAESGGTWAGAKEALDKRWVPVFICDGEGFPDGNRLLLKRGGLAFPIPFEKKATELADWLDAVRAGSGHHHSAQSLRSRLTPSFRTSARAIRSFPRSPKWQPSRKTSVSLSSSSKMSVRSMK